MNELDLFKWDTGIKAKKPQHSTKSIYWVGAEQYFIVQGGLSEEVTL